MSPGFLCETDAAFAELQPLFEPVFDADTIAYVAQHAFYNSAIRASS